MIPRQVTSVKGTDSGSFREKTSLKITHLRGLIYDKYKGLRINQSGLHQKELMQQYIPNNIESMSEDSTSGIIACLIKVTLFQERSDGHIQVVS